MEENSNVKFSEAQVALARQWVAGDLLTDQKEIILSMPREDEGLVVTTTTEKGKEKDKVVTIKVAIPMDDNAAREVVERFQDGASGVRSDDPVADNVTQHRLQDGTSLLEEKWLGTEAEELNACVFFVFWIFRFC